MELYRKVRLACRDGMSERAAARHFGISRQSVRKMLEFSVPPGYRRTAPVRRPKLDGFTGLIDEWLRRDRDDDHRKQKHTAKRIFERLRDEHGFAGGYTIVKDYVREHHRRRREMYVPLVHPPGHGQADFGQAWAYIGGVKRKVHFFALDLPQSDASYVRAYPAATAEAWVDGHVHAFSFFGKVPLSMLYDNDRCLVSRIERDGTRRRTQLFSGFLSHYLIRDRYGRPGKGNDKGAVEGLVGWSRRNFMVPLPRFASFEAFNEYLERRCRERQGDMLRGHRESIGERLKRDLEAMAPLPAAPFDACHQAPGQVSSQSLVRFQTNDYSVPVGYGHRQVWVRGYVEQVVIGCGTEVIARHRRSYEGEDTVFDPLHYLALIERKLGALDQAAPLAGWELPDAFATLRRLMEARSGRAGRREYVQVLRLLETFGLDDVHAAVKHALRLGAIGFDAVREAHVGENVVLGLVHEGGELRRLGPELVGDLAPLGARGLGVLLGEGGGDEGGDDAPALAAGTGQQIAHEVHAASLPGGAEDTACSGLEPLVVVGDHQLHASQPTPGEGAQELGPEGLCLGRADRHAQHLAPALVVDGNRDGQRHRDDPPGVPHLHIGRIEPEVRPLALERALEEAPDLVVDLRAQPRHLALGDARSSPWPEPGRRPSGSRRPGRRPPGSPQPAPSLPSDAAPGSRGSSSPSSASGSSTPPCRRGSPSCARGSRCGE